MLAVLLAPLAACSIFDTTPKPAPPPLVIDKPGQKVVRVSDANDGASIVLERSQQLAVSLVLVVNTRLEWSPVDLPAGVLAVQGSRFEWSQRPVDFDTGVGFSIWQLRAEAPGNVDLKFDLRRPHSLDPATRTVTYHVSVK